MSNTYKEHKDSQKTDAWLAANGIDSKALYVGTAEVYQALKLATNTLKTHGGALGQNEAHTLNNFIRIANSAKRRAKITQAQCFKVMNIAKQAIRLSAKRRRPRRSHL